MAPSSPHATGRSLAAAGVWTDGYVPLARYMGGLDGALPPGVGRRPWALALSTDDALVFHACAASLCLTPTLDGLWDGLGPELGRVRKADVEALHVLTPSASELRGQAIAVHAGMRIVNHALTTHFPNFLGTLEMRCYQALVAVRCTAASGGRDVWFGVPPSPGLFQFTNDLTPNDVEDFVLDAMPEGARHAAAIVRQLSPHAQPTRAPDPDAVEAEAARATALAAASNLATVIGAAPRRTTRRRVNS